MNDSPHMSISVSKGGNVSLMQTATKFDKLFIGLGWSVPSDEAVCDIDASAFLLGENNLVRSDEDFIFYNQPSDGPNGFICLGDDLRSRGATNETACGELDRQNFSLDLDEVPPSVHRIVFCLTIHEAEQRNQSFGGAEWVNVRLVDQSAGVEMMRFHSGKDFSTETAIQIGEIYRRGPEWKFRAVGQGYAGGLAAMARSFGVDLEALTNSEPQIDSEPLDSTTPEPPSAVDPVESPLIEPTQGPVSLSKRKRRSTTDIMAAITADMGTRLKPILPQISAAIHNDLNESSSRLILDRILQHVLGYSTEEIKAEQKIQGRTADYVLTSEGVDTIVIEAKRIGSLLKEKQIFQATSYAAYSGIKWALLTNVAVWQLYKVSTTDKIEPHLVFTIDLRKGLTDDVAYFFALISRSGMMRKTPLERLWLTRRALSPESLISAILHEDVLNRIRNVIARDNGISLDLANIKAAVERDILKL